MPLERAHGGAGALGLAAAERQKPPAHQGPRIVAPEDPVRPDPHSQHDDEQIDVSELAGLPAIESYLFAPPSLAPSAEDLEEREEMDADEAPRRLGFGLRRSLTERLTRGSARAADQPAVAGRPEDPFATLLTPLSDPELAALQAEVEADEIIYDRVQRAGRSELLAHRLGLMAALLLAFSMAGYWFDYLQGLVDVDPPKFLVEHLDADQAQIGVYALGVLLPLLALGLVMRAGTDLAGALLRRDVGRLVSGVAVATFALISFKLMDVGQLAQGIGVALSGLAISGLLRVLMRGSWRNRRSGRGDGAQGR